MIYSFTMLSSYQACHSYLFTVVIWTIYCIHGNLTQKNKVETEYERPVYVRYFETCSQSPGLGPV